MTAIEAEALLDAGEAITQNFLSRFHFEPEREELKPMTKSYARLLIDRRMRSAYSNNTCNILKEIVNTIPTGKDYLHTVIQGDELRSSTIPERIMSKTGASERTFYYVMKTLTEAGLVKIHRGTGKSGQDQYSVYLESLRELPVKTGPTKEQKAAKQHKYYLKRKAKKELVTEKENEQ